MRLVLLLCGILAAVMVQAQPTHELCGACHTEIVTDFKTHPHFANQISCDTCHGASVQHRTSGGAAEPDKIAGPRQVPALCGSCHVKPVNSPAKTLLEEFTASTHGQAVKDRTRGRAPNCGTCHGVHQVRTAKAIENRCNRCHESLPPACSQPPPAGATANVTCAACHIPHSFKPKGV